MPARKDFDVLEFRPWFNWLILLGLDENGQLRYRVHGTACAEGYGMDLTGRRVDQVRPEDVALYKSPHQRVITRGEPVVGTYRRETERHGRRSVEQMWLPLSSDGTRVDQILSCGYYSHA
jgi:hypothetical protein